MQTDTYLQRLACSVNHPMDPHASDLWAAPHSELFHASIHATQHQHIDRPRRYANAALRYATQHQHITDGPQQQIRQILTSLPHSEAIIDMLVLCCIMQYSLSILTAIADKQMPRVIMQHSISISPMAA